MATTRLLEVNGSIQLSRCGIEITQGELLQTFSFDANDRQITVGRGPENRICLSQDSSVSLEHCEFVLQHGQGYRLVDKNSRNGVWIGDIRVCEVILTQPTQIRVGDTWLWFRPWQETYDYRERCGDEIAGFAFQSQAMKQVYAKAKKLVELGQTHLLLTGESGAGKNAIAEILRHYCKSQKRPFVPVDCTNISHELAASALFGHTKGAFTGATENRDGAFQQANGGVLFLDEVGDIPLEIQARLLHALSQIHGYYEFTPVGSKVRERSQFTLICATNKNLLEEIEQQRFRKELYYRIAGYEIEIPPLRKRADDLKLLIERFLAQQQEQHGQPFHLPSSVESYLMQYAWPGNVRELDLSIRQACLNASMENRQQILLDDFHKHIQTGMMASHRYDTNAALDAVQPTVLPYKEAHQRFLRDYLVGLLNATNGSVREASGIAGVDEKTIRNWKKELGITTTYNIIP